MNELKYISFDKFKKRQVDLTVPKQILIENWKYRENRRKKLMQKVIRTRDKMLTFDSLNRRKNSHGVSGKNRRYKHIDYKDMGRNDKLREKNVSKVSVSYTRSDTNSKPLALEVKYSKNADYQQQQFHQSIADLRERQIESEEKLHKYLNKMFQKEQRDKERQQKYLQLKKLESQEYLKLTKLEAEHRKRSRLESGSISQIDPEKVKRTDDFFQKLQDKHLGHRNNSLPKLQSKRSKEMLKNRVKWQDSEQESKVTPHNRNLVKNLNSTSKNKGKILRI